MFEQQAEFNKVSTCNPTRMGVSDNAVGISNVIAICPLVPTDADCYLFRSSILFLPCLNFK